MVVNVNVSKDAGKDYNSLINVVGSSSERLVLADKNVVIMNLDDYEDMLFLSNCRIQSEIDADMREFSKTGGLEKTIRKVRDRKCR